MKRPDGAATSEVLEILPPRRSDRVVTRGEAPQPVSRAPGHSGAPLPSVDPRLYQIAVLSLLLTYGMVWLDLEIEPDRALAILATALLAQLVCTVLAGLPRFDPRSALISGLSLCLLLRTNEVWPTVVAAIIAVGSKFVVRVRDKHVFNPTNVALVIMLATGHVWVSPGQWGSVAVFAFLLASAGCLVVNRASR